MQGVHLLDASLAADERIYAIGDVHGCVREFDQLMAMIELDKSQRPGPHARLIFLGDYCDRGPDSKGVIDRLIELKHSHPDTICLMGNHEEKFLRFLEQPEDLAVGMFTYGGIQTSQSYGLRLTELEYPIENAAKIRNKLLEKIPGSHLKFMRKLNISSEFGDYFFCHAGIRPGIKLKHQSDHDLMWIRQEFVHSTMLHEKIIVHGHTPHFEPEVMPNRINVDTHCYESGILTCLVLETNTRRFLRTGN